MTETYAAISGATAEWHQPRAMERRFELREGDRLVAALAFRSSFGTLATAETYAGTWTFKRTGFLSPQITVRSPGVELDIATYAPRFWGNGGVVAFADGASLTWRSAGFFSASWAFLDATGSEAVGFRAGVADSSLKDVLKTQATVSLQPGVIAADRVAMLLALGFYLLILHRDEAAAATVVATS